MMHFATSKSRPTILLVEDEQTDVRLFKRALSRAGVENSVEHLDRGDTALAYLQGIGSYADRERYPIPVLIILDVKLQGLSGLELLHWIRLQKPLRRIPVLVLTSESSDRYMEAAYDAGANSYLLKSFSPDEMERVVSLITQYWLALNESPMIMKRAS